MRAQRAANLSDPSTTGADGNTCAEDPTYYLQADNLPPTTVHDSRSADGLTGHAAPVVGGRAARYDRADNHPFSPPGMEDTSELEARARAGSGTALAVLVERWRGRLHAYAQSRIGRDLGSRLDADDVVQEALMYALRAVRTADLAGRDVFGWLCGVADDRLTDLARRHRAARRDVAAEARAAQLIDALAASMTSPSAAAMRGERETRLAAAVAALPAGVAEMLRLRYADGLASRDIAEKVGKTDDAVRAALSRALRALEHAVGDAGRP